MSTAPMHTRLPVEASGSRLCCSRMAGVEGVAGAEVGRLGVDEAEVVEAGVMDSISRLSRRVKVDEVVEVGEEAAVVGCVSSSCS